MVNLTIDGQKIEVEEGITILKAASELGIEIPTLCYHPALVPYQACRVCVVEVVQNGGSKLAASCGNVVEEGMIVKTDSERVKRARRIFVELLLARAPASEVIQDLAKNLGIKGPRFKTKKEEEKCILCGLCVRICNEVMKIGAISFANRGAKIEVSPPFKEFSKACTTCGACAFVCPTGALNLEEITENKVTPLLSEFNESLGTRPCIYIPFPQAVPNKPVLDTDNCMFFKNEACRICEQVCEPDAIIYEQKEEIMEVDVGTIVVATGFDSFDASLKPEFGYGLYDNVITGLEFERLASPSGPTKGEIIINGKEPKAIVFIHCVGSRDKSVGNEYCSRVCCMYTAKHAHLIKEKIPDAKITVFYTDMRAFGKGFEEFYDRVREEGIIYRRGNASEIYKRNGKLVVRAEDTLLGKPIEVEADLVVLATGIVSRKETKEVANLLKLSRSSDGFFLEAHPKLRPVDTATDGIYLAGCCQGPKDIPDSVAQAKGAASSAIIPMSQGKVKVEPITSTIDEDICSGCRVCEPLCTYSALSFDEGKKIMFVNDIICKGCGSCGAACPAGAISMNHFTNEQVLAQIEAVVSAR